MTAATSEQPRPDAATAQFDVLIVGAGVSGIGCACHLRSEQPGRSYAILEAREASGGTWDLFRYPGIRSDSDLHTFGYEFKPWREEQAIADGSAILRYVREAAREHDVERHIRLGHRVEAAAWSSEQARWTVHATRLATGESVTFTCSWLFSATGYYRYEEGYTPRFEGVERFPGPVVHPQHWPEGLDCAGRRIVVIGSGATAITLVPALADAGAQVTMLQRSPTYVVAVAKRDSVANALKRLLPARAAYALIRRKNVWLQQAVYRLSRSRPRLVRRIVRAGVRRRLPAGFPVDTHFNPRYDPWDQRLCAVPDGDLFEAIGAGSASIVTDRIETFTERGLQLASGEELEADVIVTATGLNLLAFGGVQLSVDDEPVALADTLAFKGMLLSDVPNFAFAAGYTNASWTLKVDLVCAHLCRLLAYMDAHGHEICVARNEDPTLETRPLMELAAGYVQRSIHELPRQGTREPWSLAMSYAEDVRTLRRGAIEDPALRFSRRTPAARPEPGAALAV